MSGGPDELLDEAVAALRSADGGNDGEATLARVLGTLGRRDAVDDLLEEATSAYAEVHGDEDDVDLAEATLARIRATSAAAVGERSTPPALESAAAAGGAHLRDVSRDSAAPRAAPSSSRGWTTWAAAAAALLVIGLGVPTTWAWATGQLPALMARVGITEPPASDAASGDREPGRASVPAPRTLGDDPAPLPIDRTGADGSGAESAAAASGSIAPPPVARTRAERSGARSAVGSADPSERRASSGAVATDPSERTGRPGADATQPQSRRARPDPGSMVRSERAARSGSADARRRSASESAANAPGDEVDGQDPETHAFAAAHRAHFDGDSPAVALSAWDAYLAAHPHGRYEIEARYNRALCLVRLGRLRAASDALRPFADGRHGGYREADARALVDALSERLASDR